MTLCVALVTSSFCKRKFQYVDRRGAANRHKQTQNIRPNTRQRALFSFAYNLRSSLMLMLLPVAAARDLFDLVSRAANWNFFPALCLSRPAEGRKTKEAEREKCVSNQIKASTKRSAAVFGEDARNRVPSSRSRICATRRTS